MSEKTLPELPSAGLPRWPERISWPSGELGQMAYKAVSYDAAMARLRVAVERLREATYPHDNDGWVRWDASIRKALDAIGPLPVE